MLSLQRSSCPSSSSHYMTPWFARPAPRGPPPLPQRSLSPMTDEELAAEEESFYDQSEEMTFKNRYPSSCYKKPSNQPQHHQGPPPPSRSSSHHHPQSMILPESHQQHIGGSSTLDSCGSISHHQRSYSSSSCDELDLPSDPRTWMREDVQIWIRYMSDVHGLPSIQSDRFLMNGKALCLMTMEMFCQRVPLGGKMLYKDFQLRLSMAMYQSSSRQ